jgi:hypothetical protein
MNRDFVIFEYLHLSQVKVALLIFFALSPLLIILIGLLSQIGTNTYVGLILCCVGLLLVYGLGFSRYRIFGYVRLYFDKIEVIDKDCDVVSSFPISKIESIKMKMNGVYNCDPVFQGICVGPYGNTSKKAISKLVISTKSETIVLKIRAKGMDFVLLEEIIEAYKVSGITVQATIFK